jgi:hypothetical protein
MKTILDKFGRAWKLPLNEVCPVCGQPDNSGDCNHKKLSKKQAKELGASFEYESLATAPQTMRVFDLKK